MSSEIPIGRSAQALYQNIVEKARKGYSVESGCKVSINSGVLASGDTLSVASGSIWFDGSPVSVAAQNVEIPGSDTEPRKDVVYLDGNGDAQVAKGNANSPPDVQDTASRFEYITPEPKPLNSTTAVVLAEVWIPDGATSISGADVADRRVDPNVLPFTEFDTNSNLITFDAVIAANDPTNTGHLTTKSYVDSKIQGLEYQEAVLAEQNSPPGSPSEGDRYLIDDSPTGDWSGHANEIAEYDGSDWTFDMPNEGWAAWIESDDHLLNYNGSDWVTFGSTLDHGTLQGLSGDDHSLYLPVDGSRSPTSGIDWGGNPLSNVSDFDSDSIENKDYSEPVGSASGQGSGVYDLDLSSANLFSHTLTEATEFTFSNATSSPAGNSFTLLITQDGSTQYGITWPSSVEWNGGSAPSDPETGAELEVSFISYDGGTSWKGRKSWGS